MKDYVVKYFQRFCDEFFNAGYDDAKVRKVIKSGMLEGTCSSEIERMFGVVGEFPDKESV